MSQAAATPTPTNSILLNGQPYEMLPLNWKQLKECKEQIIIVNNITPKGMFTEEEQDAILVVITASLQRRRNDISKEFVAEHLDLGNVGPMLKMCFGQKVEAATRGEAEAATSQS